MMSSWVMEQGKSDKQMYRPQLAHRVTFETVNI